MPRCCSEWLFQNRGFHVTSQHSARASAEELSRLKIMAFQGLLPSGLIALNRYDDIPMHILKQEYPHHQNMNIFYSD